MSAACSRPVRTARVSKLEPAMPAEIEARQRLTKPPCSYKLSLLFPGLGQLCTRRTNEGLALMALGAAELGTGLAVGLTGDRDIAHPAAALPLLAFQDLWIYGFATPGIDAALANQQLYAPQDSLKDLVAAPFNLEVMKRPAVWAGILGTLALGIGVSLATSDGEIDRDAVGGDPNIFGHTFDARYGYPLGFGIGAGLFTHVAIAEETLFRGSLQSSIARRRGERAGWLNASIIFGAAHALNAFFLPSDERRNYLLYGVPFITGIGAYMGWVYKHEAYSLAPSVAVHFWYDLLLSMTFFALDPQNSPLSARIAIPF
jgi:membrane protease YdiL (CAAX protease family)